MTSAACMSSFSLILEVYLCVYLLSISTAEGSTSTAKNRDHQSETLANEQYADIKKLNIVPHQTAPSGEEYALSTKAANGDTIREPKPTPAEYNVIDVQTKITDSSPQQVVAGYDVIKDEESKPTPVEYDTIKDPIPEYDVIDLQKKASSQQLVAGYDVIKDDDDGDSRPANQGVSVYIT